MELHPIWKDYVVSLGSSDETSFSIFVNGNDTAIYHGVAHRRPVAEENTIRINDICADYLAHALPNIASQGASRNIIAPTFRVTMANPEAGESDIVVDEVRFTNDWSYEFDHDPSVASAPIDGIIDPRQPLIYSTYNDVSVDAMLTFDDGTTMRLPIALGSGADFNGDFNNDFAISVNGSASGSVIIAPSAWEGLESVAIGDVVYKVQDTCARYALYYTNAYGGWDSFAIQSIAKQKDTLTKHTNTKRYDNTHSSNRGKDNYLNEVVPSWELNTHYLTDEQSLRMHHLLGSTCVYLYDMERDEMWPVTITDKSVSYLTAKNNGRQFPSYTINVELARTRIRR